MFEISKTFEFSCAHSVYSQELNRNWAKITYPKCRRLPGHGHNYKLTVYLSSKKLDKSQMVTDFGHLSWLKEFLDECFDHKLLLSFNDPAFRILFLKLGLIEGKHFTLPKELDCSAECIAVNNTFRVERFLFTEVEIERLNEFQFLTFTNFSSSEKTPLADFYQRLLDGIALFKASPTSENLAQFFYYFISENIKPLGITCSRVKVFETHSSSATFSP